MGFPIRPQAVLVAALFIAACAPAPVQPFHAGDRPGEIIHPDSGFHFPARIGSFARFAGYQYDAQGRDVSVGYNGDIPLVVTVYVFPAGGQDLQSALLDHSAEVLTAYPDAQVVDRRAVQVTPGEISAESVSFAFSAMFHGRQQPLHSELVLARHGERFVKYRITYPLELADLAAEDSSKFLQHFAWP